MKIVLVFCFLGLLKVHRSLILERCFLYLLVFNWDVSILLILP